MILDAYPLVAPAEEPLSITLAKLWARIDGDAFDELIPGMIQAARQIVEHETGSKLITQTWRVELERFPFPSDGALQLFPVQAVDFSVWNGSAFVPAAGAFRRVPRTFTVTLQPATTWPAVAAGAPSSPVRADVTVGYGSASEVPHALRQYIAAHVAYWVRNPEAATERSMSRSPFLDALLDPFRTWT